MTKTLTEQWRDGTLPRGGYYIKLRDGSIKQTDYDNISKTFDTEYFRYNVSVKEVLSPVPSYDIWKNIKEQWKVAIPQIERLQEQLKEANEILKVYGTPITRIVKADEKSIVTETIPYTDRQLAEQYLKKWGVQ